MVVMEEIRQLAENATNTTISTDIFITETGAQLLVLIIGIIGFIFGIYQFFRVRKANTELSN
jgi:hypothetical protein